MLSIICVNADDARDTIVDRAYSLADARRILKALRDADPQGCYRIGSRA